MSELTSKNVFFPYYSGNIRFTKVIGYVSLEQFINSHKNPKISTINILESVKEAVANNDLQLKRKLKHKLYSFTPSVYINKGFKRCYDNIKYWTGLMQLDFDGYKCNNDAVKAKTYIFNKYNQIVCCYLSPSELGFKALIKIQTPTDVEMYKAIYKAVENEFGKSKHFDTATKNAVLPLFLSIDKKIMYRDYNECATWTDVDYTRTEYVNLNKTPTKISRINIKASKDYYARITIDIVTKKITEINNNGHPQVVSAFLILGSRCGAGYLKLTEARQLAINLISSNNYLRKGTKGYIDTANWCLNKGYKNPMYYK